MTKRRRGLGNLGVDVLLSAVSSAPKQVSSDNNGSKETMMSLSIETIQRGKYQPRTHIEPEALQELANSIRAQGVVQPIVVRPIDDGYELIAGERRWRAAQLAGLEQIPAVIKAIPDQAAAAISLIENIQREDLNPLEEAAALQRLIEEFDLTHQQVAEAVGRSRTAVSNLLRLIELGDEAKQCVQQGKLEMGHARALLALKGNSQVDAVRTVVSKGLTVRETERYVKLLLNDSPKKSKKIPRDTDVIHLEQSIADKIGARVDIRYDRKGRGSMVIHYNNLDELDGILERIH